MELSALPNFQDCSAWSEISAGDAEVQALHAEMCARSAPPAAPAQAEAPPDLPGEVQTTTEPEIEAIPVAQQNFALIRDGSKVVASNPGAKKVAAILDDDSDTFMRNDCRDDKWVVLELSQVAKVSRIELAQHELYSSRVRDFEVRGRQTHPRTDGVEPSKALNSTAWKLVGRFTAERAKGVQDFAAEHPIWARFLLVRFLTHHGAEPVCAVNGLAVYGKSAAEELEDQLAEDLEDLLAEEGAGEEAKDAAAAAAAAAAELAAAAAAGEADGGGAGRPADGDAPGGGEVQGSGTDAGGGVGSDAAVPPATAPAPAEPSPGPTGAPTKAAKPGDAAPSPGKTSGGEAAGGKAAAGAAAPNATATAAETPKQQAQKAQTQPQAAAEAKAPSGIEGAASGGAAATPTPTGPSPPAPATKGSAVATVPDALAPPTDSSSASPANGTAAAAPTGAGPSAGAPGPAPGPTAAPSAESAPEDALDPLPVPKTKAGGGIYETLVQEIRVAKAAQRQSAKALDALQRNVTALAAALSRVTTEYQLSEAELAARVEALVEARLAAVQGRVRALDEALGRAGKREHAALSLLAMLGGALAVSLRGMEAKQWPRARAVVVALALANGIVGVALHWKSAR